MRIGILTTHEGKAEDNSYVESGTKLGHEVTVLNALKCSLTICQEFPEIYYEGEPISNNFDIVIPRIDVPHTDYGYTILKQFESMHIFTTELARHLILGRDKLQFAQRMLKKGIPFPATGFAYSKEDFHNIINTVGGVPLIIKLVEGTEGVGVFLADDMKHAVNLLKTFKQLSTPLIMQKFIEESAGTDVRAYVIDGEVVGALQRQSQDDDFRANVALGGHTVNADLSDEEKDVVVKAAEAIGINVAGVDLIRSNEGPLIIEINTAADFHGPFLQDVMGIDMAGLTIEYAVKAYEESLKE